MASYVQNSQNLMQSLLIDNSSTDMLTNSDSSVSYPLKNDGANSSQNITDKTRQSISLLSPKSSLLKQSFSSSVNEDNLIMSMSSENSLLNSTQQSASAPHLPSVLEIKQSSALTSTSTGSMHTSGISNKNQSSLVYWDRINELLNEESWRRLERVALDLKNVADLLLTDNNCLSISIQALSEVMDIFSLLVLDERRTNFLVVSEPASPSKENKKYSPKKSTSPMNSPSRSRIIISPNLPEPQSNQIHSHSMNVDQQYLIDSNRLDEVSEEEDNDSEDNMSLPRRRKIISQMVLLYDLMQKVRHLRVFNGTRRSLITSNASSTNSRSFASTAVDRNIASSSSFTYRTPQNNSSNSYLNSSTLRGNTSIQSTNNQSLLTSSSVQPFSDRSSMLPNTSSFTSLNPSQNLFRNSASFNSLLDNSSCSTINVQCLRSLQSLYLDEVPLDLVKGLQSHRNRSLRFLTIRRAGVTKICDIAVRCCADMASERSWEYLLEADFSYNPLVYIDPSVKHLKNLQVLQLTHCDLKTAHGLSHLSAPLKHLDLSYNQLSVLPALHPSCYESLLSFRVVDNSIIRIQGAHHLIALQHLELQNNLLVLPGSLAPLGALAQLVTLRLIGNPLYVQKKIRIQILSRLHPKCADNHFTLDEHPLSDSDLKSLSTSNWIFGQSKSIEFSTYEENAVSQSTAFSSTIASSCVSPEDLLRAQQAVNQTAAAQRLGPLIPEVPSIDEEIVDGNTIGSNNYVTGIKVKNKKKKSRTRYIEIADAEDSPANDFDYLKCESSSSNSNAKSIQSNNERTEKELKLLTEKVSNGNKSKLIKYQNVDESLQPIPSTSIASHPDCIEFSPPNFSSTPSNETFNPLSLRPSIVKLMQSSNNGVPSSFSSTPTQLRANGGVLPPQLFIEDLLLSALNETVSKTRKVDTKTGTFDVTNSNNDDQNDNGSNNFDSNNEQNINSSENIGTNGKEICDKDTPLPDSGTEQQVDGFNNDLTKKCDGSIKIEHEQDHRFCSSFSSDYSSEKDIDLLEDLTSIASEYPFGIDDNKRNCLESSVYSDISSLQSMASTEGFFLESSFHTALSTQLLCCDSGIVYSGNNPCSDSISDSFSDSKDMEKTYENIFSPVSNEVLESLYHTASDETITNSNLDNKTMLSSGGSDSCSTSVHFTDTSVVEVRKIVNDYYTLSAVGTGSDESSMSSESTRTVVRNRYQLNSGCSFVSDGNGINNDEKNICSCNSHSTINGNNNSIVVSSDAGQVVVPGACDIKCSWSDCKYSTSNALYKGKLGLLSDSEGTLYDEEQLNCCNSCDDKTNLNLNIVGDTNNLNESLQSTCSNSSFFDLISHESSNFLSDNQAESIDSEESSSKVCMKKNDASTWSNITYNNDEVSSANFTNKSNSCRKLTRSSAVDVVSASTLSVQSSTDADGDKQKFRCILEHFHQPRFVIKNSKKSIWGLKNIFATLVIRPEEIAFKFSKLNILIVPLTAINYVEPVSERPTRFHISYSSKLNANHSILFGTTSQFAEIILQLLLECLPTAKVLQTVRYQTECKKCRSKFNKNLAFDFKEDVHVVCPNCGWFISGKESCLDEINEDLFRKFKSSHNNNNVIHNIPPTYTLYFQRSIETVDILLRSNRGNGNDRKKVLRKAASVNNDKVLNDLDMKYLSDSMKKLDHDCKVKRDLFKKRGNTIASGLGYNDNEKKNNIIHRKEFQSRKYLPHPDKHQVLSKISSPTLVTKSSSLPCNLLLYSDQKYIIPPQYDKVNSSIEVSRSDNETSDAEFYNENGTSADDDSITRVEINNTNLSIVDNNEKLNYEDISNENCTDKLKISCKINELDDGQSVTSTSSFEIMAED